ncbi:MAG: 1-deoxy-D-xylulose-5-phosphate synthase [Eubacteriales bacterium]|nr:1-deoxy-D-xylulose-5-phosphate synthase [Eubacteriales bacterium]
MAETRIPSLDELKRMDQEELEALAQTLRGRILEAVSKNGGHLASNLGVVELTIALHRVFDSPKDKIIFDVGHQCYAHKMLTGRDREMAGLRCYQGLAGFPKCEESLHDAYETGHASTAISAALGMARARDLRGEDHRVIAVVGDGALTGGLCYEALNDAGNRKTQLIVILNDNQMSISPNVGAISNYLTFMRSSRAWMDIKKSLTGFLPSVPVIGKPLLRFLQNVKGSLRNFLIRDRYFDTLGFQYLGPLDGHDERYLEKVLRRTGSLKRPVLIHVVTQKGKGYAPAEEAPWAKHGVTPFNPADDQPIRRAAGRSFGKAAGSLLTKLAAADPRIVAVTAAMTGATGFEPFQTAYPDRLFDVGIAEPHAMVLAAGLAKGGLKPFVAIYDTFLQRAYDQVVVDVCLQRLPVTVLMDRAAMGGEDGPTHHGVFGTSYLRHVPELTLLYPRGIEELEAMIRFSQGHGGPVFIRYPREESEGMGELPYQGFTPGRWERLLPGGSLSLVAVGPMVREAVLAREKLLSRGINAQVVNASSIKPLDGAMIRQMANGGKPYVILEEQALAGGLGSVVLEYCQTFSLRQPDHLFALPDAFVPQGSHEELLRHCGLDAQSIYQRIMNDWTGRHETAG